MSTEKKILVVFPHNFFKRESGVNKRYFELITLLKEKGFSIDLLGLKNFKSSWTKDDLENSDKLIDQLFLYDFRTGFHRQRFCSFLSDFFSGGKNSKNKNHLPDYAFPGMISVFNRIVARQRYDFILFGYVYWANLLKESLPRDITTVLTIEDFISLKVHEKSTGQVNIEALISEEIKRVNLFDKVICLSHEELKFFTANAVHPEYYFIPVFMHRPPQVAREKEFDLLFIGFDNEDNIEGLDWFFTRVHPLLPSGLKIVIIGKINRYAPVMTGVTKLEFVSDLGEIYAKSRLSINPLQKGTGMKVKVVESLAYGIPIVNTMKGLCGMSPEILEKFIIADEPEHFAGSIMRLLTDERWYAEQCNEAKGIFEGHFEASVVSQKLDQIFTAD